MYLHLLVLLALSVGTECTGQEFIAAFLENIAYYYPGASINKGRITAGFDGTVVTIEPANASTGGPFTLQAGEIQEIDINVHMELDKAEKSMKAMFIKSNKNITFEILNQRNKSVQSAVLLPTTKLSKSYQIPPIPGIQYTTQPEGGVTEDMTERSPFKLIIVNGREQNQITVPDTASYPLEPYQVLQVWVTYGMVSKLVEGGKPFLAFFGHSCAVQFNCTCGLLYTPLQPSTPNSRYIVPPIFGENGNAFFLKSSNGEISPFSPGIKTVNGPLLVHRPGMLMNMIPETEFCSCFAIHTVASAMKNIALIVTPADSTGDVYNGNTQVTHEWPIIDGTEYDYKYATVNLSDGKNIIWNKSARMGVWFLGDVYDNELTWFGHPAACLSKQPDYRGCAVKPEKLEILEEMTWKESIQACKDRNLSLIILSDEMFQNQTYKRIQGLSQNHELWMGMRKSTVNGEWYWLNKGRLNHTNWSPGHPSDDKESRCAQMNLTDSTSPGWISKRCCTPGRPVCYQKAKLLTF